MQISETARPAPTERVHVAPTLSFDLTAEAASLRQSPLMHEGKHTARTLSMHPDLRLVLMVLRAGGRIHAHKVRRAVSVQTLAGHVVLNLQDRRVDMRQGNIVVLDKSIVHDLVAVEDSTVLLSLAGDTEQLSAAAHARAVLAEEHQRFSKLLDLMASQLALFHRGETPDYDVLQDAFFYMVNYPDRFHHPKEDLLFAIIAERAPAARAHVDELTRQHRNIASAGRRFLDNLQNVLNDGMLKRQDVEQPALEYIARYREHLALEEREIFPLGQRCLRPEDWAKIDSLIKTEEDPLFGALIEERYLTLHKQLTTD